MARQHYRGMCSTYILKRQENPSPGHRCRAFPEHLPAQRNCMQRQTRHQVWLSGCMQGSPGHLDCPRPCVPETHAIMPGHEPACRVLAASRLAKNLHDSTCRILIGKEPAGHQRHHA